jgi:histidinol-phosphate aminotransferase
MLAPTGAYNMIRIRPDILAMDGYTPSPPLDVFAAQVGLPVSEIIKLDANENPYGPPPGVHAALAKLNTQYYPDPETRTLRALLSEYLGVDMEYILVGSGSDELLHLLALLFLEPGTSVITCPPTFSMYAFHSVLAHANNIAVPRRADFSLDIEAIESAAQTHDARLLFLTSPNNPDGGLLPQADLDRLLQLPLVVVLDEAYIEFSGAESAAKRVANTPNLIVLHTFSKWAGLAGMRIGYGIFPLEIIQHLWKIKQPYNMTSAAEVAACAAISDIATLHDYTAKIVAERDRFIRQLADIPYITTYPTASNYVLCRFEGVSTADVKAAMNAAGILLRYFDGTMQDTIRISIGTPGQMDRVLGVLRQIGDSYA